MPKRTPAWLYDRVMSFGFSRLSAIFISLMFLPGLALAETAAFDLPGPSIQVRVSRGGSELPIGNVPNLQEGDRLWIHPGLPESQSANYLLIVAFLRGTTNPPPEDWFTKIETWNKHVRQEGVLVTVPKGAEQALMFLAPETGGDFSTLRSTVRGKPGAFVRASQDLNRAGLDRSRLDAYLNAVKRASDNDPDRLKEESTLLARSLNIKLDKECFDKPSEQQAPCLMQNTDQLVLDDSHTQSMMAELTSGASADLIGQISNTRLAGAGYYSAYVGAVVDVVRLMTSFHTPEYQYIPALALPKGDQLDLQLNTPPSFQKPKSVLVIALPAVQAPQLPMLRAVEAKGVYCLQNASLVLPVEGAPLVFSTDLGHDWTLHVEGESGPSLTIPLKADAARGGFVIDSHSQRAESLEPGQPASPSLSDLAGPGAEFSAAVYGRWGFESLQGPTFKLRISGTANWTVAPSDETALIVGRESTVHLKSDQAACVEDVTAEDSQGRKLDVTHKLLNPGELQVNVGLQHAAPGMLMLELKQSGLARPDQVSLHSYSEAAHLGSFTIDGGDHIGLLKGTRLDQVSSLELNGIRFVPGKLNRVGSEDALEMSAPSDAEIGTLHPGVTYPAHAALLDGRSLHLSVVVQQPRPRVTLLSKSVQADGSSTSSPIRLQSDEQLPQNARLSFSLKSQVPEAFPRDQMIEVATQDESLRVLLSVASGALTMQDAQTVLAVLDPRKDLGPSAFGPLRFRPVAANGEKGDWQPLATLVRLPTIDGLRCARSADDQCTLQGSSLYLLDSISSDPQFLTSTPVPDGFAGTALTIPHPSGQELFVKLRDDRTTVNKMELPISTPR